MIHVAKQCARIGIQTPLNSNSTPFSFSNSYSILVKEKSCYLFARENTDVLTFKKLASGTLHFHSVAFTYCNQDCYEYTSRVCKKS